ncbi:hypothetical protein [Klebsiella pneumoniae]|uniref:hypothetical protein n=1 Tax=Klebsiella pneumoniae TaxID=573 RepID=UPI002B400271|nr:hypothetical protein [Klebsiella pneumoniae]
MAETDRAGWLPAALDECRVMQQRRQEVVDPAEAWRDIGNAAAAYPPAGLSAAVGGVAPAQSARARPAVNFVVREEHLWSVARYAHQRASSTASGYPVAKFASTAKR